MKSSIGALATTVILALGVWTFFYVFTPEAPLTPPETLVVVAGCAVVVLATRWFWSRLRRSRGSDGRTS